MHAVTLANLGGALGDVADTIFGAGLILSALGLRKLRKGRLRLDAATLRRSLSFPATLVALALLSAAPARCDLLTNGTPPTSLAGGQGIGNWVGAEPFTVNTAFTLDSVEFAIQEYVPAGLGTLDYFIYSNSYPYPGTLLASGANPVSQTSYLYNGGTSSVSVLRYDFDLNTPLNLTAGTYWVALNFTNTSQFVTWVDTTQDVYPPYEASAPGGTTNWSLGAVQLYLGASDTPLVPVATPEPASFVLLGSVAAIGWALRRSRLGLRQRRQCGRRTI